ncbi:serine hydrolase domain-containing protein [Massilia sp. CFBP9012]|uniref:serine hydrolase domain-containing protein n=1 Tax=Massilia sp. CFBP9012 TaxID=3096531 RepID=UPI002A6ADA5D|nr:serine hydrolase domain-containing protein [Massilia sp. CFBP9012]MDY0976510.1 serine hydrolase domain-containing protein [Massilia sp. CFBP9012]
MKNLMKLLGLLLIAAPLQAAPNIESQIGHLLHAQGLQGAVWTTLDSQGAAGASNARTGAAMRVDHRVHVGSIAKTLLAVGVLRMVSEGRLSLDTPVATLLPHVAIDNPWEPGDPVRIRHLLDHTAGLDDAHLWHVFSMRAGARAPLAAAVPAGSPVLRVRQRPGSRTSYSNIGYTLLGMVIETITGQAYETYLDTALLAPLGMRDSSFAFVTQEREPRLAMGHLEDGVTQPASPTYVRPGGQFTTTAADMARLARFVMSDGRLGGKTFIDMDLLREMGESAGTEAAIAGLTVGYGLGLRTIDRHGVVAKCHGGSTVGFRAMLCLLPETRQAFFIAINADSETADYSRFDEVLFRSLQPAQSPPAPVLSPYPAAEAWEGWYVLAPSRFESFRFLDIVFNALHVRKDGESLALASLQSAPVTLHHAGGGLFRAEGKRRASHALVVSAEGVRVISTGTQSYEQVSLAYLLAVWLSVAAGLLGLSCIVVKSLLKVATGRLSRRDPLWAPCAGVLALLLPIPLFYQQSFLELGDLTLASGLLAAVTAALPAAMLIGLWQSLRQPSIHRMETAATLAVLQFCLVLAWWGLLPLRLWG